MSGEYKAFKRGKNWVVSFEDNSSPVSICLTRYNAWVEARRLARGCEGKAILLGWQGKIIARNTYEKNKI